MTTDTAQNAQQEEKEKKRKSDERKKAFDDMNPLQQLVSSLFMLFVQNSDCKNESENSLFSSLLGFDNVKSYKDWRSEREKNNWSDWQQTTDLSRMNFEGAGQYLAGQKLPSGGDANFDRAVKSVLRAEGGLNTHEPDGAIAKFGFNSKANPDLDVRNLSMQDAISLYKQRYWDKIDGIDKMSQSQALVAFDCAVNCGVGTANRMLRETGGDTAKMLEWRRDYYNNLASKNPAKYEQYLKSWQSRVNNLETEIARMDDVSPTRPFALAAAGKPGDAPQQQAGHSAAPQKPVLG